MTSRPRISIPHAAAAALLALVVAGCASTSGIEPAAKKIAPRAIGLDAGATMPEFAAEWWRAFNDRALIDIVDRALAGNPTLRVAQARIERARAAADSARAGASLQVTGDANATRQRFSENSIYPPPLGGSTQTLGTAQINGAWELDFFGRNRSAIEAAVGAERAARADADAARVLLSTQAVRQYVQLARLVELRAIAERALEQRTQTLALIRQRVAGGLDTNVELRQGEATLPEARRQIEEIDGQIAVARHALAALTAQPPDAYASLAPALSAPQAFALPAAVPADLLGRRADIQSARWRVEAATGDVAAARAQFYPNVSLTAFVGLASIGLSNLVQAGSLQYGIGPALHLPIFDAGRLRANLRGKTADLDVAVETYNGAVLDAVRDVADQLTTVRSIERQQAEERETLAAAESALDLATQRFRAGLSTYLTVLTVESTVLTERRNAAELRARDIDTRIALIRALGGGYVAERDVTASL
jgi:NodT family efflux transporter outer membrane factor (OMF) lipoprotein